jgi:uncharacterized protein YdeI (YjbR/CyaY-like superfamily)
MSADYPQVQIKARAELRAWLERHHATSRGVWVVRWKKDSGHPWVSTADLSEEALCFGWVDSQPRSLDGERSQLLVTPRKPRSSWSRVNRDRIARLEAAGLMAPAGRQAVAIAKSNGSWSALDAVENLEEPPDLVAALDALPAARAYWDTFPRSTKRAILEWIGPAKSQQTRDKRVSTTVSEAAQGRRANQWPRRET